MADKKPILTIGHALKILLGFDVTTAGPMGNVGEAIKALLEAQLAKAEPYYTEKGRQMAYKELADKFREQGLIETLETHDAALKEGKDV